MLNWVWWFGVSRICCRLIVRLLCLVLSGFGISSGRMLVCGLCRCYRFVGCWCWMR